MAKRKKKKQNWIKDTFGNKLNHWDVILAILLISSGWYIYDQSGIQGFYNQLASGIFYAVVIGFIVNTVLKRASK